MTITYFPFDAGAGSDVTEDEWREMAEHFRQTGVLPGELNELEVFGDSSGLQVKVKSGKAWVKGHYMKNDAELIVPISTAHATLGRIDLVVVKVDFTGNVITIETHDGTASGSPAAPALTQTASIWETKLAEVTVAAVAATINSGDVEDTRTFSGHNTTINFILGTGSSVIATGIAGWAYLPKNMQTKLLGTRLSGDQSGSIQVDLWHDVDKDSISDADSITNGNEPALSADTEDEVTDLSGYSDILFEGGVLLANVDSSATIQQATLAIDVVIYPINSK